MESFNRFTDNGQLVLHHILVHISSDATWVWSWPICTCRTFGVWCWIALKKLTHYVTGMGTGEEVQGYNQFPGIPCHTQTSCNTVKKSYICSVLLNNIIGRRNSHPFRKTVDFECQETGWWHQGCINTYTLWAMSHSLESNTLHGI